LSYASPAWGYVANAYINKLQTFQNKVLRIITKLPRITPIANIHEKTGMSLIRSNVKSLARALYLKPVTSENRDTIIPSVTNICVLYPCLLDNPLGTATLTNT
jgi:hypothetical protein